MPFSMMKKFVKICCDSTKLSLGHTSKHKSKQSKHYNYRKTLQARHMYPLLYRLQDVKYRLGVLKEFRSRAAIEFNHLHMKLSLCILFLSGRTRAHNLTNFVEEIGAIHQDVGKAKLTASARSQHRHRKDPVNSIYCGFSVHTSRVYVGETSSIFRCSDHRRQSCRSNAATDPASQRCHRFMARQGHWKFCHAIWFFKPEFDRKVHEKHFIRKYSFALNVVSRSRSTSAATTTSRTCSRPCKSVRDRVGFKSQRLLSIPSSIQPFLLPALVCYGGAGGATGGLLATGKFDPRRMLVIEYDPQVIELHRALYPQVRVIKYKLGESLHATKAKIKKFFPSKSERRRLYMHASPPCQLLSSMNTSGDKFTNIVEGMRQVHWSIDLFERLKARFLTIENVPRMHKYFKRAGYRSKVIVASECSATPQARKRAIITNFKFKPRAHGVNIPASSVLPHIDTNEKWIINNYGHEQPLTIPSLTVVGSGLRYSYANGNRSPMPLTDMYLLQGGRPSHLPIIATLPTVFGRQCIGDMIPLPMMEMIGDQVFNYALSLFSSTSTKSTPSRKIWSQSYSTFETGKLSLRSCTGPTFFNCNYRSARKSARSNSMFDILDAVTTAHKRRTERESGARTYRVDFEYGELVELDATKLLTSFRCEEVAFVVDGVLRQSTLSKALWAIKKRRCNVLFLREPTCRYGHPVEREKVIEKILKNPYRGQDLMQLTTAEMVDLYTAVSASKDPKKRGLALRSLTLACKRKYGVHPHPAIYFSMPATAGLTRRSVMDFLSNLLSPSRLPIAVKNALLERTTVSFKKQSSLESIICNASKWGQEWDRKKKWQCDCHKIRHHLGANISTHNGHCHSRLVDCTYKTPCVLSSSIKNVTHLTGQAFATNSFLASTKRALKVITTFSKKFLRVDTKYEACKATYLHDGGDRTTDDASLVDLCLQQGFFPTHKTMSLYRSILRRAAPQPRYSSDVPTTEEAVRFSNDLKGVPVCPVDKNKGAAHVTCPRLWWDYYKKTIWENPDYIKSRMSPKKMCKKFRRDYTQHEWSRFGKFDKKSDLPYAYIFCKEKDLKLKTRTIVSTTSHPLKDVQKTSALAMITILRSITPRDSRYASNLFVTFDASPLIERDVNELISTYGKHTRLLAYAGDIENMYNRLPLAEVLLGIRYCIWRAQRKLRFQNEFVYVHRGRPDLSRLGCRYETDDDDRSRVHEFSFADLYEFCKYDLENAVFVFNSVVCRFKDGIPQGGTRSPADAMAYCIYSEDMFFRSIYDLTYLRKGGLGESGATSLLPPCMIKRYFDDCRLIVAYDVRDTAGKKNAQQLIDYYSKYCYSDSAKIIPEPADNGFNFLQCKITLTPKYSCEYVSKNWAHWLETGRIKLQLLQSYFSYCDSLRRQRFSTIVGKFHEIRHFSYPKSNIRAGVISITPDLVGADYPPQLVQRALYRMYEASGMSVWRQLCYDMPTIMEIVRILMFDPDTGSRCKASHLLARLQ